MFYELDEKAKLQLLQRTEQKATQTPLVTQCTQYTYRPSSFGKVQCALHCAPGTLHKVIWGSRLDQSRSSGDIKRMDYEEGFPGAIACRGTT
jgi:hypothetical protein